MTAMASTVPPVIQPGPSPVPSTNQLFPGPFLPAGLAGASPQFARRVRMSPEPGAAALARAEVAAAIRDWGVAVDLDAALLLTSELVTNAVTHGARLRAPEGPGPRPGTDGTAAQVVLAITACATGLRVDVHDGSGDFPVPRVVGGQEESGRGLLLVTSLSAEWGCYRTPAGKAVYFTLDTQ
jgi:Histidine kinase-like ATPase domain